MNITGILTLYSIACFTLVHSYKVMNEKSSESTQLASKRKLSPSKSCQVLYEDSKFTIEKPKKKASKKKKRQYKKLKKRVDTCKRDKTCVKPCKNGCNKVKKSKKKGFSKKVKNCKKGCVENCLNTWYEDDNVVTAVVKYEIKEGQEETFLALLPKYFELVKANEEKGSVHYGFVGPTEDGYVIFYNGSVNADALLFHLGNINGVLNEILFHAQIVDLQVYGPPSELAKLKEPLKPFYAVHYPYSNQSLRKTCTEGGLLQNESWYEVDKVVTAVVRYKIKEGQKKSFMALLPKYVDLVKANEGEGCVQYSFVGPTEDGDVIFRNGVVDADALLFHLANVGAVMNQVLEHSDIVDVQVHGPASELEKLKDPLAPFYAALYPLDDSAIRSKNMCSS